MHVQGRCRLAWAAAPPQTGAATDSDGVEDSALHRAEARWTRAVPGMAFQRALEPHTLAVGAQPKHRRRDTPGPFAFRVRARPLAGVVMAVQASREIARLARVGCGPVL